MRCMFVRPASPILLALALFCAGAALGQFTTVINVPPDLELSLIEPGTQVNVYAGGMLSTTAPRIKMHGAELNVHGGLVDELVSARDQSRIDVNAGQLRSATLISGSQLTSDGSTISRLEQRSGSQSLITNSHISWGIIGTVTCCISRSPPDDGPLNDVPTTAEIRGSDVIGLSILSRGQASVFDTTIVDASLDGGIAHFHRSKMASLYLGPSGGRQVEQSVVSLYDSEIGSIGFGSPGTATIVGGAVGGPVYLENGATLNFHGGSIKRLFVTRWGDSDWRKSTANVYGGTIGPFSEVNPIGILNMYGGKFDGMLRVYGGEFHFHDGTIDGHFNIADDASLHWRGGAFKKRVSITDSDVYIYGTEFALLGDWGFEPLIGLTLDTPQLLSLTDTTLRIHRADGSVYNAVFTSNPVSQDIYLHPTARIHLVLVQIPEPATITLVLLGLGCQPLRRRLFNR